MPVFTATLKHSGTTNGVRYEKGMSVQVVTQTTSNPLTVNGGKPVIDAFMRMYGIDIKKAGLVSSAYVEVR
ncbi:DUF6140 family protein [Flammeovirga agarivorans]|uniref:Uncharacterized protein n=1 Tax=Flammeovirga agarivorans TaxID=2726742 RepID=A0A7X8SGP8_9BACT|nr:DUF6140 family protein [Flammeovirga agarivorans]NLR89813.1 hypothetical protein [Flammeovirga agarivorans]